MTTPLSEAAYAGNLGEVQRLLGEAAQPQDELLQVDHLHRTALHWAAVKGDAEVARVLLGAATARVEELLLVQNGKGRTALHLAAEHGWVEFAKVLLEVSGAGAWKLQLQRDRFANTALHQAVRYGYADFAKLLLEVAGSNVEELLSLQNKASLNAFDYCDITMYPDIAHFLLTYPPAKELVWPVVNIVKQQQHHLVLGLTASTATVTLEALKFPEDYRRNEELLSWVTACFGTSIIGYDLCAAIKMFFQEMHYNKFSVVEVLVATGHSGVGKADVFLSHAQKEPLEVTLQCVKHYELQRRAALRFFLDYFCLRQCEHDFNLPKVRQAIVDIGCTAMLCEPAKKPFALSRTFCIFELFSTVDADKIFQVVVPPSEVRQLLNDIHSHGGLLDIDVRVQDATTRDLADKEKIDDFISQGPGHGKVNSIARTSLQIGMLEQAHRADASTWGVIPADLVLALLRDTGVSPALAQKVLTTPGASCKTLLHRFAKGGNMGGCAAEQFMALLELCQDPIAALKCKKSDGETPLQYTRGDDNREAEITDAIETVINAIKMKMKEMVKAKFRQHDKDKNGWLSLKEFEALFTPKLTRRQCKVLFDAVDKDRNGKLSINEFVDYVCSDEDGPSAKRQTISTAIQM